MENAEAQPSEVMSYVEEHWKGNNFTKMMPLLLVAAVLQKIIKCEWNVFMHQKCSSDYRPNGWKRRKYEATVAKTSSPFHAQNQRRYRKIFERCIH